MATSKSQQGDEISSFINEANIVREKNVLIGALQEALGLFNEIHNLEKNLTPGTGFKDAAKSISDYNKKLDEARQKEKEITDAREKSNRELQNEEKLKQQKIATSQKEIALENEQIKQILLLDKAEQQLIKTEEARNKIKTPKKEPIQTEIIPGDLGALQDIPGGTSAAEFQALKDAELDAQLAAQKYYDTAAAGIGVTKEQSNALNDITLKYDKYSGSLASNIAAQVENAAALAKNKAEQKSIQSAISTTSGPTEKQIAELTQLRIESEQLTSVNKNLSATIRQQAKEATSSIGSLDELASQLEILRITYSGLTEVEKSSTFGTEIKAEIDILDPKVKSLDAELGKFGRNVGNYSQAMNILKPALAEVAQKIDILTAAGKADSAAAQSLQKEYRILDQLLNSQAAGFANAKSEIQANEKALLQMSQAGLDGTASFKQLQKATGDLKDDLADTRAATKALGSDTFVFDGLIKGAQGLAGAYGAAQSVQALFGVESEELQKTLVKLQAVQTLITSLQQIQNTLQKENAFILLLQQTREKALLAVMTIKNFVLRGNATATVANTVATTATAGATSVASVATTIWTGTLVALRAALIATGIGAVIVLIVALALAFSDSSDETEKATEAQKAFQRSLDEGSDAIARQNDLLDKNLELKKLQNKFKFTGDSLKDADATAEVNTLLEKRNLILRERDRIQAEVDRVTPAFNKLASSEEGVTEKSDNPIVKTVVEGMKRLKELNKEITDLNHEITVKNVSETADRIQQQLKAEEDARKKAKDKALADSKDFNQREVAAQIELARILLEEQKNRFKSIADDEKKDFQTRLNALRDYQVAAQKLIDLDANQTKNSDGKQKTKSEIDVAKQKGIIATFNLQKEVQGQIDKLYKQSSDAYIKLQADDFQAFKDNLEKSKALVDDSIELRKNKDSLKAIKEETPKIEAAVGAEARAAAEKRLQDRLTEIEREAELSRSLLRQEELQSYIQMAEALGQDTTKLQAALTAEQLKESKLRRDIDNDEFKSKEANIEKEKAARAELGKALVNLAKEFAEGIFDRQKNDIQDKINLIETEKQANIDKVNSEVLTDQEKADKIAVINATSDAKKKQQEDRQKQVDMKRAQFERIATIVSIVSSTAKAVMGAVAASPETGGLPFSAIAAALGAVQIATVLARPLPKFKGGKRAGDAYSGPAIVDDGGYNEPIWRAATRTLELSTGQARDRVTHVAENDVVFQSIDHMLAHLSTPEIQPLVTVGGTVVNVNNDKVVDAIRNMDITTQFVTERGHQWRTTKLANYRNYVNKYVKG